MRLSWSNMQELLPVSFRGRCPCKPGWFLHFYLTITARMENFQSNAGWSQREFVEGAESLHAAAAMARTPLREGVRRRTPGRPGIASGRSRLTRWSEVKEKGQEFFCSAAGEGR